MVLTGSMFDIIPFYCLFMWGLWMFPLQWWNHGYEVIKFIAELHLARFDRVKGKN